MRPAGRLAAFTIVSLLPATLLAAQAVDREKKDNPISFSLRQVFDRAAGHVLRVAELAPAEIYTYRPETKARSLGEQLAHTADVMYQLCAVAAGTEDPVEGSLERSRRTKAEILAALEQARNYCGIVYSSMTDERALQAIDAGPEVPRFEVLVNNIAHIRQHYGSVRTYLRVNGIEPPAIEWVPRVGKPTT